MLSNFTDALFFAAEQSIPNKVVINRPTDLPWINGQIKKLIRKRKRQPKFSEERIIHFTGTGTNFSEIE